MDSSQQSPTIFGSKTLVKPWQLFTLFFELEKYLSLVRWFYSVCDLGRFARSVARAAARLSNIVARFDRDRETPDACDTGGEARVGLLLIAGSSP